MSAMSSAPQHLGKHGSRPQQTNDERSAQTRGKLLDAAISLLFTGGYGAATTTNVAKKADVSRGAMTHHFRTRADLMMAVAEKVFTDASSYRIANIVRAHEPGPERYFSGADVNWEMERTASSVALLEIMMASRNDEELQQRFSAYLDRIDELKLEVARMVAKDLGVDDIEAIEDMLLVHFAMLRGLSIRLMFTRRPEEIERARLLCKRYERMFVAELLRLQRNGHSSGSNGA
jgi:AcrR family transcriptional regulator